MLPIQVLADARLRCTFCVNITKQELKLGFLSTNDICCLLYSCFDDRKFTTIYCLLKHFITDQTWSRFRKDMDPDFLWKLIEKRKFKFIRLLFIKKYFTVDDLKDENESFLNICVHGNAFMVDFCIRQGLTIDNIRSCSAAVLKKACQENYLPTLRLFMGYGLTINDIRSNLYWAFEEASKRNYTKVMQFLLDQCLTADDIGGNGGLLLRYASSLGNLKVVKFLVRSHLIPSQYLETELKESFHNAVHYGKFKVANFLLKLPELK